VLDLHLTKDSGTVVGYGDVSIGRDEDFVETWASALHANYQCELTSRTKRSLDDICDYCSAGLDIPLLSTYQLEPQGCGSNHQRCSSMHNLLTHSDSLKTVCSDFSSLFARQLAQSLRTGFEAYRTMINGRPFYDISSCRA